MVSFFMGYGFSLEQGYLLEALWSFSLSQATSLIEEGEKCKP